MLTTSCEMDKGLKFGRVMFFSQAEDGIRDRKGTRLNSSHLGISYSVFCLTKKISCAAMATLLAAIAILANVRRRNGTTGRSSATILVTLAYVASCTHLQSIGPH